MDPFQPLPSKIDGRQTAVIKSTCRLCYNGCGVLVRVEKGRPISVTGDPEHPLSKGALCPRGRSALELLNHPDRLRYPLKRSGLEGADGGNASPGMSPWMKLFGGSTVPAIGMAPSRLFSCVADPKEPATTT